MAYPSRETAPQQAEVVTLVNLTHERANSMHFSRISKLLVDKDDLSVKDALACRKGRKIALVCGSDVGASYTLQVAVLTAAALIERCFPGAMRVVLDDRLAASPLLPWRSMNLTFEQALAQSAGTRPLLSSHSREGDCDNAIVFGNASAPNRALRITFDGWIAAAGPANTVARLPERDDCVLAGILASSLAVSEIFMSVTGVSVEATRRPIALSLWRPDADVRVPEARGVPVEFLPGALWVLGLGHLGNAYLWALAALPYRDPSQVEVVLNDFDKVEPENVETGLLFTSAARRRFKTRVCSEWLERREFRTKIVERRFDEHFRCRSDEPRLALCGFDNNVARRCLESAEFHRVIESGLGGRVDNFDTLAVHTFPQSRCAQELWPDASPEEEAADRKHRMHAAHSAAYAATGDDECGRIRLAGKSIAVPFVGTAAACFALAEAIRLFHERPAYSVVKLRMAAPAKLRACPNGHMPTMTLPFAEAQNAVGSDGVD